MAQKHANPVRRGTAGEASPSPLPAEAAVTTADVDSAQSALQVLLTFAKSHPPNIGMGALIMATSLAAREMNIPLENIAAMFDRTISEVYAMPAGLTLGNTVN